MINSQAKHNQHLLSMSFDQKLPTINFKEMTLIDGEDELKHNV